MNRAHTTSGRRRAVGDWRLAATLAVAAVLTVGGAVHAGVSPSDPEIPEHLLPRPLDETATVTLAGQNFATTSLLPLLVAERMGEFERENLDVDIQLMPFTEATLLVSQGRVDAAGVLVNAGPLNLIADDAPVRFVLPYQPMYSAESDASGFWVRNEVVGPDGLQPDDLRGVPIASSTGAASGTLGHFWLSILNAGGDFPVSDLEVVVLNSPDTAAGLENGSIGAGFLGPPFNAVVRDSGCCTFVAGSATPYPLGWFLAGPSLLDDRRDVGEAVFRALARTMVVHLAPGFLDDPVVGPVVAEILESSLDELRAEEQPTWDPQFAMDTEAILSLQEYWQQIPGTIEYGEVLTSEAVFDVDMFAAVTGQ